jgi:hypothetical protein
MERPQVSEEELYPEKQQQNDSIMAVAATPNTSIQNDSIMTQEAVVHGISDLSDSMMVPTNSGDASINVLVAAPTDESNMSPEKSIASSSVSSSPEKSLGSNVARLRNSVSAPIKSIKSPLSSPTNSSPTKNVRSPFFSHTYSSPTKSIKSPLSSPTYSSPTKSVRSPLMTPSPENVDSDSSSVDEDDSPNKEAKSTFPREDEEKDELSHENNQESAMETAVSPPPLFESISSEQPESSSFAHFEADFGTS